MEGTPLLISYLSFFFQAWKKAYNLGWIFHRMVEAHGIEVALAFFKEAEAAGYPLVAKATRAHAGTPFFLTVVNKRFSDWVFAKTPTEETFVKNVLANAQRLQATEEMWGAASKECAEDLRQRGWEALDTLGGKTKGLKMNQLRYDTRGRRTGKGAPERTWAKK
jgi:hypothetical protein